MSRNTRRVRASDIAEMGFCETKCLLKARHGDRSTPATDAARRGGDAEHQRFHHEVTAFHNQAAQGQPAAATDRRCFIASAVYGVNDPRTDELRSYRDIALKPKWYGPSVIKMYYAVSPLLAEMAIRSPGFGRLAAKVLDNVRRRIAPAIGKEARYDPEQDPQDAHPRH